MNFKSFIGVDLHTDGFVVCSLKRAGEPVYQNYALDAPGLAEFFKSLRKNDEVAVEATSNSAYFLRKLKGKVKRVTLVAPAQFAVIGKSVQKSDKLDSYKLAYYLSKNMLPRARHKPDAYIQIISLIDTRAIMVRTKSALIRKTHNILVRHGYKVLRNRLATMTGFERYVFANKFPKSSQKELETIDAQIKAINKNVASFDEQIAALAATLPGYENLLSISGIGPLSAATLLGVIGPIEHFATPDQLCSYFGIVPKIQQSGGTVIRGRITKAGSKTGRAALVQSTWVAIKFSPYLKEYFERIKARGNSKKAIVACARKLLTTVYYTLKNDWVFDDFPAYRYHQRS